MGKPSATDEEIVAAAKASHAHSFIKRLKNGYDTVIGEGVIDFARVLLAAQEVGCEYTVIEQKTDDPYGDIQKSFKHLNEIKSQIEE